MFPRFINTDPGSILQVPAIKGDHPLLLLVLLWLTYRFVISGRSGEQEIFHGIRGRIAAIFAFPSPICRLAGMRGKKSS